MFLKRKIWCSFLPSPKLWLTVLSIVILPHLILNHLLSLLKIDFLRQPEGIGMCLDNV